MKKGNDSPQTLMEAIRHFSDPDVSLEFVRDLRWPDGVTCPHCNNGDGASFLKTRRIWKCKACRKQFSVRKGTIFEDSPLPLDKWLVAIWMIANPKNGVSSYEIARAIGVTQKTAWFMLHRIRLAMQTKSFGKLKGEVEVDETYIRGKARNMHADRRRKKIKGRGTGGKAIVMGLLERHGKVRTKVVLDTKRKTVQAEVQANVEPGAEVFTDELASYRGLDEDFAHEVINHAEAYVRGKVHTNSLENYWSLFKRCVNGTWVSVEPFHLFRYLDEEEFRFNNRKDNDAGRFVSATANSAGKRLTYEQLTGNVMPLDSADRVVGSVANA